MYNVGYATFSPASFSMSSHVVNKTYNTLWIKKSYSWTPRLMCIFRPGITPMSVTGGPRRASDMTPPPNFRSLFPSLCVILYMLHIMVEVVERKILRSICGHNKDTYHWSCRFNKEIYDLFKGPRLSVAIRIVRLLWAGHVARMEEICMPKRLTYTQLEGLTF